MITSLMMTTYNRLNLTKQTLDSLWDTINSDFRLIIVDDCSSDGTKEYLKSLTNPSCKYLVEVETHLSEKNGGVARARNIALKLATKHKDTDYFCCIDNDVLLPNGWLGEILDIMSANRNFSIGVNFEGTRFPPMTLNGKTFQFKHNGNLGSALMVFPRTLHEKVGFFNEEYRGYSCEDSDWGFRARLAGFQLGYIKEDGNHLGGEEDQNDPYRIYKNERHLENVPKFRYNCALYAQGKKPLYIPFNEEV